MRTLWVLLIITTFTSCRIDQSKEKEDLFQLSGEKVELGEYDAAISMLEKFLAYEPDHLEAKALLIGLKLQQGKITYKEAAVLIEEVLQKEPDNRSALSVKSEILNNTSDPENTLKHVQRAILANPQYFQNYHDKGMILIEMRRYKEAIKAFNNALKLEPNHMYSIVERAVAKYKSGDKEGACEDWGRPGGGSWKYYEQYCVQK